MDIIPINFEEYYYKKAYFLGVLTKLTLEEINNLIKNTNIEFISLQETANGITDSTYIGTSKDETKYIFKVFETSTKEHIENEIYILNALENLNVPHPLSNEIIMLENKPTALFSFIKGKIPKDINIKQVEEISSFLKELHHIENIKPTNKNIYEKSSLLKMIALVENSEDKKEFEKRFEFIKDIDLTNNAVIHGDLFPDNAKYLDDKLSGVYDFAQSCYGNAYFDLAVMLVSWCFKDYEYKLEFLEKALEVYDKKLTIKIIEPYILYASLYYALQRYTRVNKAKDYKEMMKKFDILKEVLDACI